LNAIEVCRGYVDAQNDYAHDHTTNGVLGLCAKDRQLAGKTGRVVLEDTSGVPACTIPEGFAKAAVNLASAKGEPYRGYFYRILTRQGPDARGVTPTTSSKDI